MDEQKKISFRDLSVSLKTLVVLGWILVGLDALFFLIGFLAGVMEAI